ncbi:LCP family protein required for cell wall assembly [Lipingzhangella halophila]|uniref:LCP family protein required for cell wall assembly n=1 Tax=Lipingzhangella halophila TaxID=1783352 RepID=A0A7W7RGB2_9ACTN|nr:LCP family protein required for cell wall assembly [Lipingzhangella halophila]
MRRRIAGWTVLILYLALVAAGVAAFVLLQGDITRSAQLAVQGRWLLTAAAAAFAVAVLWMTVIVHSWVITRPPDARWFARFGGAAVVLVLCAVIALPAGAVMRTAHTAHDTVSSVFEPGTDGEEHDAADPWNGADRVNVLLIGADAAEERPGTRTDSMMAASIDVEHGDVVLIGLPRNLENVPFPEGSALAEAYPEPFGFDQLLNDVYQTVADDTEQFALDPEASNPSADTLKKVIGNVTDLEMDYYAMVDMQGFKDLIDAIGGIEVHIDEPIPYGQEGKVLEAGDHVLDGNEALWYGRSRTNSDDYTRMGRQGCLIKYVAEQAEPTRVLSSFQELSGATKRTLQSDLPQEKLPAFIDLAEMVTKKGDMRTLQLSPPQVETADPDWDEIRTLVSEAVREQEDRQEEQESSASGNDEDLSPEATPNGEEPSPPQEEDEESEEDEDTEWQEYTGLDDPSPTTPGRQVGDEPTSLENLCP